MSKQSQEFQNIVPTKNSIIVDSGAITMILHRMHGNDDRRQSTHFTMQLKWHAVKFISMMSPQ